MRHWGQKSKLRYRHAEIRAVKVKKLGMLRPALCSLSSLFSGKGKKSSVLFLLFTVTAGKHLEILWLTDQSHCPDATPSLCQRGPEQGGMCLKPHGGQRRDQR